MTQIAFIYEELSYQKKSFNAYAGRIESHVYSMYDISPQDFAHHVRHATSYKDLAVRCGCPFNEEGVISSSTQMHNLKQKVNNMCLNTDHFRGQQPKIPDDVFKTIVRENDCLYQIMKKCKYDNHEKEKILKRIEDLDIDISHFKIRKTRRGHHKIMDAIDDETFKMLVKNNRNWTDLFLACGYAGYNSEQKKIVFKRLEELGLDINHFENDVTPIDKIFIANSQYKFSPGIKKRMLCDFDRVYECASCKNEHFKKCDGVLMWNNKEIVLQLEHKNGIHNDNRIDNLEFLCPSCHSQTSTFGCKNSKRHKTIQTWLEEGKTCHAPGSIASLLN
jgi:hypothetical protein